VVHVPGVLSLLVHESTTLLTASFCRDRINHQLRYSDLSTVSFQRRHRGEITCDRDVRCGCFGLFGHFVGLRDLAIVNLFIELLAPELVIQPAVGKQLMMRASFGDVTVRVQHKDRVAVPHRGETVRDHNHGSLLTFA
jgi:hypothetical protein